MEERDERADAVCHELVNERIVKIDALLVDCAGALGQDTRPGEGEAVVLDAHLLHQRDVLLEPMIVVAGDVAGMAAKDTARFMGEIVPDVSALAVLEGCALDLVGRGRRAPDEILLKAHGDLLADVGDFLSGQAGSPAGNFFTRRASFPESAFGHTCAAPVQR